MPARVCVIRCTKVRTRTSATSPASASRWSKTSMTTDWRCSGTRTDITRESSEPSRSGNACTQWRRGTRGGRWSNCPPNIFGCRKPVVIEKYKICSWKPTSSLWWRREFWRTDVPLDLCLYAPQSYFQRSVIPRLHDQAGSTSCYMLAGRACSMFARRLLDVCSMSVRRLLNACSTFARRLLDVCSIFARSCKRGITVVITGIQIFHKDH